MQPCIDFQNKKQGKKWNSENVLRLKQSRFGFRINCAAVRGEIGLCIGNAALVVTKSGRTRSRFYCNDRTCHQKMYFLYFRAFFLRLKEFTFTQPPNIWIVHTINCKQLLIKKHIRAPLWDFEGMENWRSPVLPQIWSQQQQHLARWQSVTCVGGGAGV